MGDVTRVSTLCRLSGHTQPRIPPLGRGCSQHLGCVHRPSVQTWERDAWSRCLIMALAGVVAHKDVRSWTDLLTLLALVLAAPSRSGRPHALRIENETRRRCMDWISGHPCLGSLATSANNPIADTLPDSVVSRVATFFQEGALRRACAALLQDSPVSPTDDVMSAPHLLHPWVPCVALRVGQHSTDGRCRSGSQGPSLLRAVGSQTFAHP